MCKDSLAEIRRAERRAEKILKGKWDAVEAVADKLLTARSRRLTHGRLMKLVGRQFEAA